MNPRPTQFPLRAAASLALMLAGTASASAQSVDWRTRTTFYGDNTEFFTPFRTGETILGAQFSTFLDIVPSRRTRIHAGVFGDLRFGSDEFLDPVKPILSFRYETPATRAVLGTLETANRHGYLEPLEVTTLEFTRPIEYGAQLMQHRRYWSMDLFLDWQGLNTTASREVFNYGLVLGVHPAAPLTLEFQFHGLHRGGQLFDAGVPVTNNTNSAVGVRLTHRVPVAGRTSLAAFYLSSRGHIDPAFPADRPDRGHGTYLRAAIEPAGYVEVFGIYWIGKDFHTDEGDPNYNSVGADGTFFRSRRRYFELGIVRKTRIDSRVELDAEFRLHRADEEESQALFDTQWEYSYRLVVRVPLDFRLRSDPVLPE
jgi:hypothetical protein